jgi:hypothetical protein
MMPRVTDRGRNENVMASRTETNVVYVAGLVQGIVLVT